MAGRTLHGTCISRETEEGGGREKGERKREREIEIDR